MLYRNWSVKYGSSYKKLCSELLANLERKTMMGSKQFLYNKGEMTQPLSLQRSVPPLQVLLGTNLCQITFPTSYPSVHLVWKVPCMEPCIVVVYLLFPGQQLNIKSIYYHITLQHVKRFKNINELDWSWFKKTPKFQHYTYFFFYSLKTGMNVSIFALSCGHVIVSYRY